MAEPIFDSEIEALRAEIGGLKIVIAVALNLLPDERKVLARLQLVEEMAKRQNMDSNTIQVLREFREKFS
jgi:hypothetical protein